MQEINIIIKNNIYYNIIWQNIFPYRPGEAVLLAVKACQWIRKFISLIREIIYII